MDSRLHFASQAYAFYMGYTDTYGHVSDNGVNPGQRIEMAGYFWTSYTEVRMVKSEVDVAEHVGTLPPSSRI